jgi:soluble lytic murein transglycosylase-like protein
LETGSDLLPFAGRFFFGGFDMKLEPKIAIIMALSLLASLPASGSEIANLRNGFTLRLERHEARGEVTRLYLTETPENYVDVSTAEILGYEKFDPPPESSILHATAGSTLDAVVNTASSRNNINPELILSVIRAESGFNPNAVSPKGARGLMQLMPLTATRLGVDNALDPVANVEGGTRYLKELLERYQNDLSKALAAYNAGPGRVEQYNGVPPYPETRAYIARIISDLNRKTPAQTNSHADINAGSNAKKSRVIAPKLNGNSSGSSHLRGAPAAGAGT